MDFDGVWTETRKLQTNSSSHDKNNIPISIILQDWKHFVVIYSCANIYYFDFEWKLKFELYNISNTTCDLTYITK